MLFRGLLATLSKNSSEVPSRCVLLSKSNSHPTSWRLAFHWQVDPETHVLTYIHIHTYWRIRVQTFYLSYVCTLLTNNSSKLVFAFVRMHTFKFLEKLTKYLCSLRVCDFWDTLLNNALIILWSSTCKRLESYFLSMKKLSSITKLRYSMYFTASIFVLFSL